MKIINSQLLAPKIQISAQAVPLKWHPIVDAFKRLGQLEIITINNVSMLKNTTPRPSQTFLTKPEPTNHSSTRCMLAVQKEIIFNIFKNHLPSDCTLLPFSAKCVLMKDSGFLIFSPLSLTCCQSSLLCYFYDN